MAWTPPKTWTNATLTTSDLNTHVRDNLNAVGPLAKGATSVTMSNVATATQSVTHGLGQTPVSVQATLGTNPQISGTAVIVNSESLGATTFTVRVGTANGGNVTGTFTVYWAAF